MHISYLGNQNNYLGNYNGIRWKCQGVDHDLRSWRDFSTYTRDYKKNGGGSLGIILNQRTVPMDIYLNTLKYLASGWANTMAETEASGSIMQPSVSSIPISSG